ncbi:hypothetical protein C7N43_13250 [Sphingobacteriales bacterium UPWRP_1]|nr:hypothetical protein BVG80_14760 [Sphingobacteriales bacterium TSM_CSM]PSJ76572.1 hypothetical protein C7N43_13250 [Sphingobacteriales bacterium UPWRP_1]
MKSLRILQLSVCFILFSSLAVQAQNTWIGGFPGHENDWNFAANWSLHHVPDEWDNVVIPNTATTTFHYPVITNNAGTVASIILGYNSYITVTQTGSLGIENKDQSNTNIPEPVIYANQIVYAGTIK